MSHPCTAFVYGPLFIITCILFQKNKSGLEQPERHQNRRNTYPSEQSTFTTVLLHCILIIASPIATFFGSKYFIFDNFFTLSIVQSNIWSAVLAVVALHLALGLFLYRAYFEVDTGRPTASRKQD